MRGHFPLLLAQSLPHTAFIRHSTLQQPFFHLASFTVGIAPDFCQACGLSAQLGLTDPRRLQLRQPAATVEWVCWSTDTGTPNATFRQDLTPFLGFYLRRAAVLTATGSHFQVTVSKM